MALNCSLKAQQLPETEPVRTSITVLGNVETESPANITTLDDADLQKTPGVNLDDRLRQIPGYSLFRRSSSLVAHPTTQGVSLRGLGSSGASRTLVLWDGVPANDPFGGWVYWTQFNPDEIARVEVSRGASTSAFGDRSMGGVIGLFSRQPEPLRFTGAWRMGNRGTRELSAGFSHQWSRTAASTYFRAFRTDGYFVVPESTRGPIDKRAGVQFLAGDIRATRYTRLGALHFKLQALAEERRNGTALTRNSTSLGTASVRYERELARDSISFLGFNTREGFHSTFSSVTAGRSAESPAFTQAVASQGAGGAGMWQRHAGRWDALAGADLNYASGRTTDHLYPSGLRTGAGNLLQQGTSAQAGVRFGPARLFAGMRHSFAGSGSRFWSPSAGAVLAARGRLRLRGSVYRSFRAPTLNELYRTFRVGNTETQANAGLRPEELFGAEAGVDWLGEHGSVRLAGYRNSLDRLITNATVSLQPGFIVRRRENAAAALSRGLEASLHRVWRRWTGDLNYLFVDSRYRTGSRVPQVPRHQGSAQLAYDRPGTMVSAELRAYGLQFDDDLNAFRLPGYAVVMFAARQRLAGALFTEIEVENALDRVYYTGFTPAPNTGQPRLFRVGLRWEGRL